MRKSDGGGIKKLKPAAPTDTKLKANKERYRRAERRYRVRQRRLAKA